MIPEAVYGGGGPAGRRYKRTPRDAAELRRLKNRLNRMAGQRNGIGRILDEHRYCGDLLIQIAAVEKALQAFGFAILKQHMQTCVAEDIASGGPGTVDEAIGLIKKLK